MTRRTPLTALKSVTGTARDTLRQSSPTAPKPASANLCATLERTFGMSALENAARRAFSMLAPLPGRYS